MLKGSGCLDKYHCGQLICCKTSLETQHDALKTLTIKFLSESNVCVCAVQLLTTSQELKRCLVCHPFTIKDSLLVPQVYYSVFLELNDLSLLNVGSTLLTQNVAFNDLKPRGKLALSHVLTLYGWNIKIPACSVADRHHGWHTVQYVQFTWGSWTLFW